MEKQTLKTIKDKLDGVAKTSGKNDKKKLLKQIWEEDNQFMNDLLVFLLDTNIVTNIARKKLSKNLDIDVKDDYPKTLPDLIIMLQDGQSATDYRIAQIKKYMSSLPLELFNWVAELVTKKYRIGATAKSLNEAVGEEVINIFACQLAHPFEKAIATHEKQADKKGETFMVAATQKLDGFRCIAEVRSSDNITFKTRKGKIIDGLDELRKAVKDAVDIVLESPLNVKFPPFVLDGELLASSGDWSTTSTLASTDGVKTGLNFHVFDALPLDEFLTGESKLGYMERQAWLDDLFESGVSKDSLLKRVEILRIGTPQECIDELMPWVKENGYEGLMFNTLNGKYVAKRTKDLMKVKTFLSDDLLVTGVFEGKGGFAGTLGGVIVDYKGHSVKVGSGFTQEQRELYWVDTSRVVGKVVEIQYFEESKNIKNDDVSLRFPTFKGIRYDKTVNDVSYES